ncbi:prepilin-type N-terminal cleavage/methylation domain-containing protein [Pelomonas sp. SE-A7]|uniref:type IV pilus modification PilV family protein n=1 Tax=Pelomonas sp. SE-A7 TaxID=3054953 RepID=UPI00259C9DBE|nr:prepilin-type N-terminal cleavage/methylation domain-containing protein [Pelomonas sp. SE-A7]MDM4767714.1 prepilin-type N-terminal cleavage/methylation domain-containing protein [Pelomonas sp. SE-A7]
MMKQIQRFQASSPSRRQRGVALIEALIAILIFAFGVLGLVGLQAAMTRAQTTGKIRADAANLASDLFGLVQTDHATMLGQYSTANCAGYPRCADWKTKVTAALPSAQVTLTTNEAARSIEVKISWQQGQETRNQYSSTMVWQQ